MLAKYDLEVIRDCAKTYEAREIILFGSSLREPESAHDIDLGVSGVPPERFFLFMVIC